jgi:hypothetical protein
MPTQAKWTPTSERRPEPGAVVDWITPSGDVVDAGMYAGGAVWLLPPDHAVYAYYLPTYWRPAEDAPDAR